MLEQPHGRMPASRSRLLIVLAFVVTSLAWIAFSDAIVDRLFPASMQATVQTLKGFGFMALTSLVLWGLLAYRDGRLAERGRALAASEERYRMLAERSHDLVFRFRYTDPRGFDYMSPTATTLTGYPPEAHYRNPQLWQTLLFPEDMGAVRAYIDGDADEPLVVRWRRPDGTVIWTEHQLTRLRDEDGRLLAIEGTARDITARVEADERQRILIEAVEATPVGVGVLAGLAGGFEFTYVNGAMTRITGLVADRLLGSSPFEFAADGGPALTPELLERLVAGETFEVRMTLPGEDGPRAVQVLLSPVVGTDGAVDQLVAVVADRTETERLLAVESRLEAVMDASPLAMLTTDLEGTLLAWNPAAEALFGWPAEAVVGGRVPPLVGGGWEATEERRRGLIAGTAEPQLVLPLVRRDGRAVVCSSTTGVIRDGAGEPVGFVTLVDDLTEELQREEWNAQLARAIDHAAEAIVLTDLAATITYVNPAFEQVTGYRADELIGRNPRILQSGLTPRRVYTEMWTRLTAGEPWRGVLVNRRKDGTLFEEDVTLSPVLSAAGEPIAYVGVKRDLTLERRLAAGLSSELNDRAAVQEAMARIELLATPEETAAGICHVLAGFDAIEDAVLVHLPSGDGRVTPLAAVHGGDAWMRPGEPLPEALATYLRTRAGEGPWAHGQHEHSPGGGHETQIGPVPPTTVAAPVRHRGRPVAILMASADTTAPDAWIARHLRVVAEIATHVGPLLGPALEAREAAETSRHEVEAILAGRAFTPVYQPVCDLATRMPVGWEALTRFTDGATPASRFAQAHEVGLGDELELACGEAAAGTFAGRGLPGWLSINLSPSVVIGGRAQQVLASASGPVVLELTEHVPIEDYARLRGAIDLLDPPVMVAVDDAGAGYASLRHVLELRPDYVKLDLALVHAIDRDPARQAMVAGMVHYASETGTQLIAEGVESEAERRTLLRLGVRYGQGFLLGPPGPQDGGVPDDGAVVAPVPEVPSA